MIYDVAIVGGGIVGLATAMSLARRFPAARVLLLEKEEGLSLHQTGRNSGVIHSGIYYNPGSYKARFARAGAESMLAFCRENGIQHDRCGKVIVATREEELPRLERLFDRGTRNGLDVSMISLEEVKEIEPHVKCVKAIRVPATGITDYGKVAQKYADLFLVAGGEIRFGSKVETITRSGDLQAVVASTGEYQARFVVNCAGLHSDRVARASGSRPEAKIVPFRGEYYELVPERRDLVKTLIYPVPNPEFPFLGVHFTRMIDGSVHAGPNAVLAFKREGYAKTDFNARDFFETMSYAGFWKLAARHLGEGMKEIHRSISKKAFVRSLQELIPEIQASDLVPCKAGVRAQALLGNGQLVDDFLFSSGPGILHVCNAPSPAATASLEIGKAIVERIPEPSSRTTVSAHAVGDA